MALAGGSPKKEEATKMKQIGRAFNLAKDTIADSLGGLADSFNDTYSVIAEQSKLEIRETYPRMPWHDCHACVSGAAARDVASHIVQRWNHHRLAAMQTSKEVLRDITDNTSFGICAKCDLENIFECATNCPRYHLCV